MTGRFLIRFSIGLALVLGGLLLTAGCEDDKQIVVVDDTPPSVPRGLYSVTGDERVYLYWYPNDESDLQFYVVYRSAYEEGPYSEIGRSYNDADFIDTDVSNGTTYYYAVTAVDNADNESDLSYETVFDTPRPEGTGIHIYDANTQPEVSAFEFQRHRVTNVTDGDADIYFDYDANWDVMFVNVADAQTDMQDFGYTSSLDDVDYSPEEGWSEVGWAEAIVGHSYIVWTRDNHFAKIRITDIDLGAGRVTFDWAYQVDPGNPELKAVPKRAPDYGKRP